MFSPVVFSNLSAGIRSGFLSRILGGGLDPALGDRLLDSLKAKDPDFSAFGGLDYVEGFFKSCEFELVDHFFAGASVSELVPQAAFCLTEGCSRPLLAPHIAEYLFRYEDSHPVFVKHQENLESLVRLKAPLLVEVLSCHAKGLVPPEGVLLGLSEDGARLFQDGSCSLYPGSSEPWQSPDSMPAAGPVPELLSVSGFSRDVLCILERVPLVAEAFVSFQESKTRMSPSGISRGVSVLPPAPVSRTPAVSDPGPFI